MHRDAKQRTNHLHRVDRRRIATARRLEAHRHTQQTVALFNIANDPYEKTDLADQQPQQVAKLQELLTAHQALDLNKVPDDLVPSLSEPVVDLVKDPVSKKALSAYRIRSIGTVPFNPGLLQGKSAENGPHLIQ